MVYSEPARNMNDPHGGFFYDLKQRLLHLFGWKLLVLMILKDPTVSMIDTDRKEIVTWREAWTRKDSASISKMGYAKCEGLKDSIAWMGVPVYAKIIGGIVPPSENLESATTLNNNMRSTATKEFFRKMWKVKLPSLSIQQIIIIVILGVGAILGMWWLGVF